VTVTVPVPATVAALVPTPVAAPVTGTGVGGRAGDGSWRRSGGHHRHQRWSPLSLDQTKWSGPGGLRCAGCESRRPVHACRTRSTPRRDSRRCGQPREVRDVGVAGVPAGAVVHHRRQLHSAFGARPPPQPPWRGRRINRQASLSHPPGRRRW